MYMCINYQIHSDKYCVICLGIQCIAKMLKVCYLLHKFLILRKNVWLLNILYMGFPGGCSGKIHLPVQEA